MSQCRKVITGRYLSDIDWLNQYCVNTFGKGLMVRDVPLYEKSPDMPLWFSPLCQHKWTTRDKQYDKPEEKYNNFLQCDFYLRFIDLHSTENTFFFLPNNRLWCQLHDLDSGLRSFHGAVSVYIWVYQCVFYLGPSLYGTRSMFVHWSLKQSQEL